MKTHMTICAVLFAVIAIAAFVGALTGASHQVFICLLAGGMSTALFVDLKKEKK